MLSTVLAIADLSVRPLRAGVDSSINKFSPKKFYQVHQLSKMDALWFLW